MGEYTIFKVAFIGAIMALGKFLIGDEQITFRKLFGRVILGAGVSMISGIALIQIPNLGELELIGIASALGVVGHTCIESIIIKTAKKKLGIKQDETQR